VIAVHQLQAGNNRPLVGQRRKHAWNSGGQTMPPVRAGMQFACSLGMDLRAAAVVN
jgi:hypothetical protein